MEDLTKEDGLRLKLNKQRRKIEDLQKHIAWLEKRQRAKIAHARHNHNVLYEKYVELKNENDGRKI